VRRENLSALYVIFLPQQEHVCSGVFRTSSDGQTYEGASKKWSKMHIYVIHEPHSNHFIDTYSFVESPSIFLEGHVAFQHCCYKYTICNDDKFEHIGGKLTKRSKL